MSSGLLNHEPDAGLQPPQSRSRRISIAELARTPSGGGGPPSSIGSHRSGSFSGGGGFALLSRRVTRLIGLQKSLRGSAIREDSRSGADDFMTRMRPDEAPTNPRFFSTLSTEGQYATFKCYERLARRCLLAAEPVAPRELSHTRTPMEMLLTRFEPANPQQPLSQQRRVGVGGGAGEEADDQAAGSRTQSRLSQAGFVGGRHTDAAAEIPMPGHSLTAYAPSRQQQQQQQHSRRISRDRRDAPLEAPPQRNAQLERQIRQSYRLENVMEVIDYLKNRRGQAVTNQRFTRHQIQPVEHYQMWVRLWNKDFVVRPRGPGEEGALKSYQN